MSERPGSASSGVEPVLSLRESVLSVSGRLGPEAVLALRSDGERKIASGSGPLQIDLSGVVGAHSATLSLLLCWSRHADECQRPLSFTGANEQLMALAALGGVQPHLFARS
ncbi:MAG: STAS domain-containing protein [Marinobacter sp.]|uniref:STAS domain-containing protein n=1 Tax=Marinobacter sp. TaxID=50741 RepID=UPI00299E15AD|nr:STAS domain-containing protein [Marinobacter sp.]MDX1756717.1 STAS domain-containing protein [Marinobacter sp.]